MENKRDTYQLICKRVHTSVCVETPKPLPLLPSYNKVRVDAAQLHKALLRFDEDTFTTVAVSIRPQALVLKSKTDAICARVKLPATMCCSSLTPFRRKCGLFVLADLLLTTRYGLLSADKTLTIAPVEYTLKDTTTTPRMLHIRIHLLVNATVDVLFPTITTLRQASPVSDSCLSP